jgi:hypothetical protein
MFGGLRLVCMPDRIPTALIATRRRGCPRDSNHRSFIGSGEGVTGDCFSRSSLEFADSVCRAQKEQTKCFLRRIVDAIRPIRFATWARQSGGF